ncbi:MAG: LmbE family protein, partial [Bacteroidota bacterium]
ADKSRMVSVDVGVFYPTKGKSNTEIAAESRSMHKCQGMGRSLSRGTQSEYLQLLKGDMPNDPEDLFEGIDVTWNRVPNGGPIGNILAEVEASFDYQKPYASLPKLMEAWSLVERLEDGYWKKVKKEELRSVIKACLGLYLEAAADDYSATAGDEVEVTLELVNRSPFPVTLQSIQISPFNQDTITNQVLENNQAFKYYRRFSVPATMEYTSPYWLNAPSELGMYTVKDQLLRGKPETPRAVQVQFNCIVDGTPLTWTEDVVYKKVDPVAGETYRPFEILPPAFVNINEPVYVFANQSAKPVEVLVRAGRENVEGTVQLALPEGWRSEPESVEVRLPKKDQKQSVTFMLYPPEDQQEATILAQFTTSGKTFDRALTLIEYDHIPTQSVLQPSQAKVVKLDLQKAGRRIGYIMGAGDEIPASLEQIGYQVDLLEEKDIQLEQLQKYDAILLGIRAYNTVDRMEFYQPILLEYVNQGGTMVVQYNTTWRMEFPAEEIAPYYLKLSRDRVAQEEAEIRFLAPEHPVLNKPNKITQADFDGWVQERGLYFPSEWGPEFTPILACNDPGESSKEGGLLVAPYGKGYYIYSGISWFRELPAGVPGAFRLFTNIISLGKETTP